VSIGKTLAEARESAGLSVDEVAHATRIRRTLVAGIEQDDYSACGGDFYARGHIRTIATKVGVDPAPLLAEFDATRPQPAPRATDVFESETAAKPERRGPNWSAAMAAALVLVVVYGVVQAFAGGGGDGGTTSAGDGSPRATASATTATGSASPTPTDDNSAVAQAPRTKVTVAVAATERSWVQVTSANGQQLFEGLLDTGMRRSFSDKRQIRLIIGNAGGVELTVNGTEIGAPGRRGQVARVQFTPQDPAAG
jgi:cytoskeletal protein RodZ